MGEVTERKNRFIGVPLRRLYSWGVPPTIPPRETGREIKTKSGDLLRLPTSITASHLEALGYTREVSFQLCTGIFDRSALSGTQRLLGKGWLRLMEAMFEQEKLTISSSIRSLISPHRMFRTRD